MQTHLQHDIALLQIVLADARRDLGQRLCRVSMRQAPAVADIPGAVTAIVTAVRARATALGGAIALAVGNGAIYPVSRAADDVSAGDTQCAGVEGARREESRTHVLAFEWPLDGSGLQRQGKGQQHEGGQQRAGGSHFLGGGGWRRKGEGEKGEFERWGGRRGKGVGRGGGGGGEGVMVVIMMVKRKKTKKKRGLI